MKEGSGSYGEDLIGTVSDDPAPEEVPVDPECDLLAPVTLYVSPDDSNSMSSPVQARTAVIEGRALAGLAIRTWEFLNYYSWSYPAADPGELAVDVQLAAGATPGDYVMQVGITSESPSSRAPMNLAFSVDASGSMEGQPMQLAREVMRAVSGQLVAGDMVSIVTWDTENNIVLDGHVVTGPSDPQVDAAIDGIASGGSTDLAKGLSAGYRLAGKNFDPERINRVVLVSDGGANVGQTDEDLIGAHASGQDEDEIYLVGVGVGTSYTYNDVLMDVVTDLGRGASVFVPSATEAERMFGDRFLETMGIAARDVQVQLDLPPGFEVVRFSGEEISTNPDEVRPQHVSLDDSVVLHQDLHACGGAASEEAEVTVTVSWLDVATLEPRQAVRTATIGQLLARDTALLAKGTAVFTYAEALKLQATGSSAATVEEAEAALAAAEALNPGDPDLEEIRSVLGAL